MQYIINKSRRLPFVLCRRLPFVLCLRLPFFLCRRLPFVLCRRLPLLLLPSSLGRRCLYRPRRRVTRRSYQPPIPPQPVYYRCIASCCIADNYYRQPASYNCTASCCAADNYHTYTAKGPQGYRTGTLQTQTTTTTTTTTTTIHHVVDNWSTTDN